MPQSPYLVVSPAYGREYKSAKAALADWYADKDFTIRSFDAGPGRYINRPQLAGSTDYTHVEIRFKADREVVIVDLSKPAPKAVVRHPGTTFESWMKAVDAQVVSKTGLGVGDLADCPFRDWFDSGVSAKSAASRAVKSAKE